MPTDMKLDRIMKRRSALLLALAGMAIVTPASAHVGEIAHSEGAHGLAHVLEMALISGCIVGALWFARRKGFF